jgi:hypothetical protein
MKAAPSHLRPTLQSYRTHAPMHALHLDLEPAT